MTLSLLNQFFPSPNQSLYKKLFLTFSFMLPNLEYDAFSYSKPSLFVLFLSRVKHVCWSISLSHLHPLSLTQPHTLPVCISQDFQSVCQLIFYEWDSSAWAPSYNQAVEYERAIADSYSTVPSARLRTFTQFYRCNCFGNPQNLDFTKPRPAASNARAVPEAPQSQFKTTALVWKPPTVQLKIGLYLTLNGRK